MFYEYTCILYYRNIFKSKNDDDDKPPPYFRLKEEKQYTDLQVKFF
jgi:hypothetical protein